MISPTAAVGQQGHSAIPTSAIVPGISHGSGSISLLHVTNIRFRFFLPNPSLKSNPCAISITQIILQGGG